jgi:hypothetical protein
MFIVKNGMIIFLYMGKEFNLVLYRLLDSGELYMPHHQHSFSARPQAFGIATTIFSPFYYDTCSYLDWCYSVVVICDFMLFCLSRCSVFVSVVMAVMNRQRVYILLNFVLS